MALYLAGFGGAGLVIGSLFLIPQVLIGLTRGMRRWPAAARIAGRDVTRLRSRSVPAIAAVIVVVAFLTVITISVGSTDREYQLDYTPTTLAGQGTVNEWGHEDSLRTLDQIRGGHPGWTVEATSRLGQQQSATSPDLDVGAVPTGCTPVESVEPVPDGQQPSRCQVASWTVGWSVIVPALVAINPATQLSSGQRAAFDQGAVLVVDTDLISNGRIRLAVVERNDTVRQVVELPAVAISGEQLAALRWDSPDGSGSPGGAALSAAAAERADLPSVVNRWEIVDPEGPISRADEEAINRNIPEQLRVERGYQPASAIVTPVLLGIAVALVAVAAIVTTALTQVEGRTESATLAALGASPGFRRRIAAAQAALTAFLGATIGVLLGLGPGIALAVALTTDRVDDFDPGVRASGPIIVVPSWPVVAVLLVVPLLAALVAAAMVRRPPSTIRRLI